MLDLRGAAAREHLRTLLGSADVLVHGYRPGALTVFGLGANELAERHPQLVTVALSAWGAHGPWAGRRGFDSVVQAASGIADACRADPQDDDGLDTPPGALPAQVLDHATGHLMAAAALRGLTVREQTGRAGQARLALASTAAFLLARPTPGPKPTPAPLPDSAPESAYTVQVDSAYGRLTQVSPPGELDGVPLEWPFGAHLWGSDPAEWTGD